MGPLKKRARLKGPDASEEVLQGHNIAAVPSLSDLDAVANRMIQQVQSNEKDSSLQPLQKDLLTLKQWQRTLLQKINESDAALETQQRQLEKKQRAVQALDYERVHLERLIQASRTFSTPSLNKVAAEELQLEPQNQQETTAAVEQFLGANVDDPTKKQHILAKLHNELSRRGFLSRDVKLKQQELEKIKAELKNKRQILDSLPDQLSVMERASKPLQKFFSTHSDDQSLRMIGTERSARLGHARSLPTPLYTLYQQLQHFVDQAKKGSAVGVTVSIVDSDKEEDRQVLLQLPVPDVSSPTSTKHKRVTIHFYAYKNPVRVTAAASGCGSTLNQDVLLHELFPSDVGALLGLGLGASADSVVQGRPYHWCNYLAGLHLVQSESQVAVSTRVVIRELQRRVRSNATLKFALQSLQRKTLPTPPGDEKAATGVKLVSFVVDADNSTAAKESYTVSLRKGQANLQVKVSIQVPRYPAVPPVWSLNQDDSTSNDASPLYDDQLAVLERQVNQEALERFVVVGEEDSYNWVLVRQLREIMQQWECWMEDDVGKSGASRSRRGRDRAPVSSS